MSLPKTAVVACEVLQAEIEAVIGERDIPVYFGEHGLHDIPKLMPDKLKELIDTAAKDGAERILLGYGLCSKGVLGVSAGRGVVVPKCHDCLSMLMGSKNRYQELFAKRPGTFYLSVGWIKTGMDPLSIVEFKYSKRLKPEKALWAMKLELANYSHLCYIDNGLGDQHAFREKALEICRVFEKEYEEIKADLSFFQNLINGPHQESDFINLPAGEILGEDHFQDLLFGS